MRFSEKLLKNNGIKIYSDIDNSIFGDIKINNNIYEIRFFYKNIFQKIYHEDNITTAKKKLKSLIVNAHQQERIEEHKLLRFNDFNSPIF